MSKVSESGTRFFPNPDDSGPFNPRADIAIALGELIAAASYIGDEDWGPIYGPAGPRIREALGELAVAFASSLVSGHKVQEH